MCIISNEVPVENGNGDALLLEELRVKGEGNGDIVGFNLQEPKELSFQDVPHYRHLHESAVGVWYVRLFVQKAPGE